MQFCFYATEIYASRDVFAMCFHVAFCCITPQERPFKKPQARVYGSYPVVGITSGKSVSRVCLLCRCVSLGGVFLYLLDVGSWFRFSPETPEHLLPALVGFSFPYDVRFCLVLYVASPHHCLRGSGCVTHLETLVCFDST